jgi:hypothetical protein
MKKLNLFIGLLICLIVFSSCSSDDDENNTNGSILGEWTLVSETSPEGNEEPMSECKLMTTLTFNSDGSLEVYFVEGENPCVFDTKTIEYEYSKNEKELTIIIDETDTNKYTVQNRIKTLTETTLEFEEIWSSEDGYSPSDAGTIYKFNKTN